MGKGSGKGAQGSLSIGEQVKAESLTRSNFNDFADANKHRKNAVDVASSSTAGSEEMMKTKLIPEEEMAELSKKLFAVAKPYRNSGQHGKSLLYVARE